MVQSSEEQQGVTLAQNYVDNSSTNYGDESAIPVAAAVFEDGGANEEQAAELQRLQRMLDGAVEARALPTNDIHEDHKEHEEKLDLQKSSMMCSPRVIAVAVTIVLLVTGIGVGIGLDGKRISNKPEADSNESSNININITKDFSISAAPTLSSVPSQAAAGLGSDPPSTSPSLHPSSAWSNLPSVEPTMKPTDSFVLLWSCLPNPEQYGCFIDYDELPPKVPPECPAGRINQIQFVFNATRCDNETLIGTGGDCVDLMHSVNGDTVGVEALRGKDAFIVVTDHAETYTFFKGWVPDGGMLDIGDHGMNGFGLYQRAAIWSSSDTSIPSNLLQVVRYRTWACAEPLEAGQLYGSLMTSKIVSFTGLMAISPFYSYEANATVSLVNPTNTSLTLVGASISGSWTDPLAVSPNISGTSLRPGESIVISNSKLDRYSEIYGLDGGYYELSGSSPFGGTYTTQVLTSEIDFQGGVCDKFHHHWMLFGRPTQAVGVPPLIPGEVQCDARVVTKVECTMTQICGAFDLGVNGPYQPTNP